MPAQNKMFVHYLESLINYALSSNGYRLTVGPESQGASLIAEKEGEPPFAIGITTGALRGTALKTARLPAPQAEDYPRVWDSSIRVYALRIDPKAEAIAVDPWLVNKLQLGPDDPFKFDDRLKVIPSVAAPEKGSTPIKNAKRPGA